MRGQDRMRGRSIWPYVTHGSGGLTGEFMVTWVVFSGRRTYVLSNLVGWWTVSIISRHLRLWVHAGLGHGAQTPN
jgi:hypothetical protein